VVLVQLLAGLILEEQRVAQRLILLLLHRHRLQATKQRTTLQQLQLLQKLAVYVCMFVRGNYPSTH
jgi:hypothetical protein